MAKGLKDLLAETRTRVQEITAGDAAGLLAAKAKVLFLDVRETEELAGGRIPGALHVPRGLLEPKAAADSPMREAQLADPDQTVVVYCASGVRSLLAADVLGTLGFRDVRSLAGGFGRWKSEGHTVSE